MKLNVTLPLAFKLKFCHRNEGVNKTCPSLMSNSYISSSLSKTDEAVYFKVQQISGILFSLH